MENQTQSRDEDVVTFETFSGLRNDVSPERFTPSDLAVALNVDLDKTGRLARRRGFSQVNAAASHSVWATADQQQAFVAQGLSLCAIQPDLSLAAIAQLTAPTPISYEEIDGRVFFCNGYDTGIIQGGTVRSWGMQIPPPVGVTIGSGNLPCGRYMVTMTWLRGDMQESGAPMAELVELVDDKGSLELTLPVPSDPAVQGKIVYISAPDGEELYEAMILPRMQTQATYSGGLEDLTRPIDTQFFSPAPAGHLCCYYRSHLYVAVEDRLYESEDYGYEWFNLDKYVQLDGRATVLAPMQDREVRSMTLNSGFFVGTDKSVGCIIGTNMDDFQYVPKTNYGAVAGAVTMVDGSAFGQGETGARQLPMFLTTGGLCIGMPNMEVRNLTRGRFAFETGTSGAGVYLSEHNRCIFTSIS